jgi:hypothetical protein
LGNKFRKLEHEISEGYIGKINPRTGRPFTKAERDYIGRAKAGEVAHLKHSSIPIAEHTKNSHKHLPPILKPWSLI